MAFEGHFVYLDGRSANNLQWMSGEPNNYHGNENCVSTKQTSFSSYSDEYSYDEENKGYNDCSCNLVLAIGCQFVEDVEPQSEENFDVVFNKVGEWSKKSLKNIRKFVVNLNMDL